MTPSAGLTLGVEEEFLICDASGLEPAPTGLAALDLLRSRHRGIRGFDYEFQLAVVESRTGVCVVLAELRQVLVQLRSELIGAASPAGQVVIAAGTAPLGAWQSVQVAPKPRYEEILSHYRDVVRRRLTCGSHVHVGLSDRDLGARVLTLVRPWLPLLLALSVSSPYAEGADTGYASSRYLLWGAFPVAGLPPATDSYADYAAHVQGLIDAGAILDQGHVYWDARLGVTYDTLEFRIADAGTLVDEVVLQAALCRALTSTCVEAAYQEVPPRPLQPETYRAATWRAARSGLAGMLIDPTSGVQRPAWQELDRMLEYVRPALENTGDQELVSRLVKQLRIGGTSAARQRARFASGGDMRDVVAGIAVETALEVSN